MYEQQEKPSLCTVWLMLLLNDPSAVPASTKNHGLSHWQNEWLFSPTTVTGSEVWTLLFVWPPGIKRLKLVWIFVFQEPWRLLPKLVSWLALIHGSQTYARTWISWKVCLQFRSPGLIPKDSDSVALGWEPKNLHVSSSSCSSACGSETLP